MYGVEFLTDPARNNVCRPLCAAEDKAERVTYKRNQEIRSDSTIVIMPTIEIWEGLLKECLENPSFVSDLEPRR